MSDSSVLGDLFRDGELGHVLRSVLSEPVRGVNRKVKPAVMRIGLILVAVVSLTAACTADSDGSGISSLNEASEMDDSLPLTRYTPFPLQEPRLSNEGLP